MAERCAFCGIASGEVDAMVLKETPDFLVFVPLHPATLGHTLVIPREHAVDVWALDPALVGPLFDLTVSVGAALQTVLEPEGMNIVHSAGPAATQTVFHAHVHVVPRWRHDAVHDFWPDPSPRPSAELQDDVSRAIRAQLS